MTRVFAVSCLLLAMAAQAEEPPAQSQLKAGTLTPVMPAPELKLDGSDGKPLSLANYRGKVVLLAFGFSNCGEVCPVTLFTLASARRKLGDQAAGVQVVYVTVDPQRDDAAQMRKFLGSFDATFVGGVGTMAQIEAAEKSYGISVSRKVYADGSYTIGHSSSIYIIDRGGGLRAVMPYGHPVDDFVHDLKILLRG